MRLLTFHPAPHRPCRCSQRCNNSISILQRQEKAAKLETCECDGTESFDCTGIKENMKRLCFQEVTRFSMLLSYNIA